MRYCIGVITMAKELPYFRFTCQEWQNGAITYESFEAQGVFINACTYYWLSDCSITIAQLQHRLSDARKVLEELFKKGIIKEENGDVVIEFLDKQWGLLGEYIEKKRIAGRKGGLKRASNATAQLKHNSSYKEKDKEKEQTFPTSEKKLDWDKIIGN